MYTHEQFPIPVVNFNASSDQTNLGQKIAQQEQLLSTILQTTRDAIITTDAKGLITYMNLAAQHLTGWQIQAAKGEDINIVVSMVNEQTNVTTINPVRQTLSQGQVIYLDEYWALIAKDGKVIPVQGSATPIFVEPETVSEVVLILADMREHRQVKKLTCEQEWLSQQILQSRLGEIKIQQKLLAEQKCSEIKSRYITMTSHEFRTPLMTILSSSELLEHYGNQWTQQKQINHLQRIQNSVKQMIDLLNGILTIGKADAGKILFNPIRINVLGFCQDLIEELQISDAYNHQINLHHQGESHYAYLDKELLQQILSNLLSNAIKYSPVGSTINCFLEHRQEQIIIQIEDQGIGIPKADQQQLFESFHRAANVDDISGTGLGLAIVRRCVNIHRGTIEVHSEEGIGTTFTVYLPCG